MTEPYEAHGTPALVRLCNTPNCTAERAWSSVALLLRSAGPLDNVRCQNICEGPVCGIDTGDHMTWFRNVKTQRTTSDLIDAARSRPLSRRLRRRRV